MVFVQPNIVSEQPEGDFLHLKTRKILQGFSITGLYSLFIKPASKHLEKTFYLETAAVRKKNPNTNSLF